VGRSRGWLQAEQTVVSKRMGLKKKRSVKIGQENVEESENPLVREIIDLFAHPLCLFLILSSQLPVLLDLVLLLIDVLQDVVLDHPDGDRRPGSRKNLKDLKQRHQLPLIDFLQKPKKLRLCLGINSLRREIRQGLGPEGRVFRAVAETDSDDCRVIPRVHVKAHEVVEKMELLVEVKDALEEALRLA